jgi:hypothetical protein
MVERVVTSQPDGRYLVVELPAPGEYTVTFELPGFATFHREGFIVKTTTYVNATLLTPQEAAKPPEVMEPSQSLKPTWPGLLAVDLFGGWSGASMNIGELNERGEEVSSVLDGFEVGATVRFLPWVGVTGAFARNSEEERRLQHYLVGARFSTRYFGDKGVRGFAHVLWGKVNARSPEQPSESGSEMVIGGGWDSLLFLRIQFDYIRLSVNGYPENSWRLCVGGVVPLCFSKCGKRAVDGFDLSGH